MRTSSPLSITLPNDLADMVRAKVASGEYASENEVVKRGLETLVARDAAFDLWLRTDMAAAYDDWRQAQPNSSVPATEIMGRLRERHARRVTPSRE